MPVPRLYPPALLLVALVLAAIPATAAAKGKPVSACTPSTTFEQPFNDGLNYVLVPGGDFEGTAYKPGKTASENESLFVGGTSDTRSLSISNSVSSPQMCIGLLHPTLRFFAKQTSGLPLSTLSVEAVYRDATGRTQRAPIAWAPDATYVPPPPNDWTVSAPAPILANALILPASLGEVPHPDGGADIAVGSVSFTFTPSMGSTWRIDDLYVDPYRRN